MLSGPFDHPDDGIAISAPFGAASTNRRTDDQEGSGDQ
jgi:hypothetical protein